MNKIIFICPFLFLFLSTMNAQNIKEEKFYIEEAEQKNIDELTSLYGKHKILPAGYELQALIALSYYPELKNEYVKFVFKNTKLPYASRPQLSTLINPFSKNRYVIIISNKSTELREKTLLKNLPFNAQIGALGHELAHTSYYCETNKLKIILNGMKYRNAAFKEKFEKMTDLIAIRHGLGVQIYEWSKAVYPIKALDGNRGKIYYSPSEILEILEVRRKS